MIVFDLETAGLEMSDPIIQIGAVHVAPDWEVLDTFEVKLKFKETEDMEKALAQNHYDRKTWKKEALAPVEALTMFNLFLKKDTTKHWISKTTGSHLQAAQLVAYNEQFDTPRLFRHFDHYGFSWVNAYPRSQCVLQLAEWFFRHHTYKGTKPMSFSLEDVTKTMGVKLTKAHDALADAIATSKVAARIERKLKWI